MDNLFADTVFELGDKDSGCLNLLESIKKNYKVAKQSYLRKNCKI